MAINLSVPSISNDDLLSFHSRTYGWDHSPLDSGRRDDETYEDYKGEDSLGYYPDGVKRTLTDEQIAMFRHSEIQSMLREHRLQSSIPIDEPKTLVSESNVQIPSPESEPRRIHTYLRTSSPEEAEKASDVSKVEDEEEEEYARFLESERKQFEAAAKSSKKRKNYSKAFDEDRKTSTRRRVREMDELSGGNDVLDYGEEHSAPSHVAKASEKEDDEKHTPGGNGSNMRGQSGANETLGGKKIWWPLIGS